MNNRKLSILALVVALTITATSDAFASRARELVLGTGDAGMILNGGSLSYDGDYNMFYNPSYVNDSKNWGIIEKSNFPRATAQGGFVTAMENFNVGLYMNRGDALANTTYAGVADFRPIELTVGADMGVKWGLGLLYGASKAATTSASDLTLRVGAQYMDIEPFAHIKLSGTNTTGAGDSKNKSFTVGARYRFGEWTPYGAYRKDKYGLSGSEADTLSAYTLGLGRSSKVAEGVKMHYSLAVVRDATTTRSIVPIDFSVEADAASWITVMGGLSYRLIDRVGSTNQADTTTTGRLGMSLHLGKADLNWAVGNVGGAEFGGSTNGQVFDLTSGFFTAASLAFHW